MSKIDKIQNQMKKWLQNYFPNESKDQNASIENRNVEINDESNNDNDNNNVDSSENEPNQVQNEILQGLILQPKLEQGRIKVFENDSFAIYIQKGVHQRQKNFKFQDTLFHIKIEQKHEGAQYFLKDLFEMFEEVFNYILSHLKTFFNLTDHNIAYLTLYQGFIYCVFIYYVNFFASV